MAFHEVRLPESITVGSRGGPGFSTSIVEGDTGGSERVSRWPNARRRYNLKPGNKNQDALALLLDFYVARMGPAIGFRFKDWLDYTTAPNHRAAPSATNIFLGTATGASGNFQLRTQYVSGSTTVFRTIEKPVANTTLVATNGTPLVAGTNFTVNTTTGLVTVTSGMTAGHSITGGCEFDVPVQFAPEVDEQFQASIENYEWGDISDIPLIEMLGNTSSPERFYYGGGTTITTTGTSTVNFSNRVWVYTASGAATWLVPDPTDLEQGGPYFMLFHGGASGTVTVKTFDNVSTIGTFGAGRMALLVVYSDAGINKWALLGT